MKNRFKLEKSQDYPGWWVLTDTENLIVCKFEEHRFNETQQLTILEDSIFINDPNCANKLAYTMAEMGNYIFSHWYSVAMPVPVFEFRRDEENDKLFILRNKYPQLTIEVNDECNLRQLSKALKSASEFVAKYKR